MNEIEYRLPDVGEGLDQAEILAWRVRPGDTVAEDDIIVEVETDKSIVELPSPCAGVVQRLGGREGDVIEVGEVLAVIASGRASRSTDATRQSSHSTATAQEPPSSGTPPASAQQASDTRASTCSNGGRGGPVTTSPVTRKRALQLGIDLRQIEGTGPGGRVIRDDVERAARTHAPTAGEPEELVGEDQVVPLRGVRREIARVMTEAQRIPAIYDWRDVPAERLLEARRGFVDTNPERRSRLTLLPFVVKALLIALREHPTLNASINVEQGEIVYRGRLNIGIATATDHGLIVPVVADADRLSLLQLGEEIARLAGRARERTLGPLEVSGGTCTISNYGSFGTTRGAPLIRPPEVTIVGMGRVHDKVVAIDGQPTVRQVLPVAVGTDHRLNDGDALAAFCDTLTAHLEEPALLLAGDDG